MLESLAPLPLTGATLDEAAVGAGDRRPPRTTCARAPTGAAPTTQGPPVGVGDQQTGTWRATTTGEPGEAIEANAEWLEATEGDRTLAMVMERNDQPSSRARYDGATARLEVDYERDVIILGPLEENAHIENPYEDGGRRRVVVPGEPFALEPAFVALGARAGRRRVAAPRIPGPPPPDAVSEGDHVQQQRDRRQRPLDRREGRPRHRRHPRDRAEGARARHRDVHPRRRLAGALGRLAARLARLPGAALRPGARASRTRSSRRCARRSRRCGSACGGRRSTSTPRPRRTSSTPNGSATPIGDGLLAYNTVEPESSSNEAGLVTWGPDALPHVEARLTDAIENWGVRYFKWDFMAWLDCAGQGDIYDFREELARDARPAPGEVPGRHVPDRRDERLPPVPVRLGRARAVVVPERVARVPASCCTTSGT